MLAFMDSQYHLEDEERVFIRTQGEVLYPSATIVPMMFAEYIKAAMDKATYEIIDDPEPFYGEIPGLQGVWATEKHWKHGGMN